MKSPQSHKPTVRPARQTPIIDRSLMIILAALAAAVSAGAGIAQIQKMLGL
jgi:hypothetical protein